VLCKQNEYLLQVLKGHKQCTMFVQIVQVVIWNKNRFTLWLCVPVLIITVVDNCFW